MPASVEELFIPKEEDLPYEEDVIRNPYVLKHWLRYLDYKHDAPPISRNILFERALKELPGSYKLWFAYLRERRFQVRGKPLNDPAFDSLNNAFERCLVYLHKMPRIWLEYGEFLIEQKKITKTRQVFNRALQSIAVTQHDRIWKLYLKFVRVLHVPVATAIRVHRRFLKWEPQHIEAFVEYLLSVKEWDEAAKQLVNIVNDEEWVSATNKSKHDMWMQLCDLISKHSSDIKSIKIDAILRSGISKFSDQVGRLWTTLADYYIRIAQFHKARDIFEEGMNSVITVKDFTQIWDAYAKFEDTLIAAQLQASEGQFSEAEGRSLVEEKEKEEEVDDKSKAEKQLDLELMIARYDDLIERQPLLLNSVLLRQNPHNVREWKTRTNLYEKQGELSKVVETYSQSLKTIDPQKAKGRLHMLWVDFAKFYEKHGDLESSQKIFSNATKARFKYVEDLAIVWCEYVELALRHNRFEEARSLLQSATNPPAKTLDGKLSTRRAPSASATVRMGAQSVERTATGTTGKPLSVEGAIQATEEIGEDPVQNRVHRSTRIWSLYADVEESLGTFLSTKTVYERMFDLKVVTPQIVINYAHFLEEHQYFEESFKAYEKGIGLFQFPNVRVLWTTYLTKFVERYGGRKIERLRELFEQVIQSAPVSDSKFFFVLYANAEEQFGLARRAMNVYERATRTVPEQDKFAMFCLYIQRATEFFGVTHTREIYERAIEVLPERQAKEICIRYADLERRLGEIDRARAILIHASQFCDPRIETGFWSKWREFEVEHGNKDTFREMLRIKRSVQGQFSATPLLHFIAGEVLGGDASSGGTTGAEKPLAAQRFTSANEMQALEQQEQQQEQILRSAEEENLAFAAADKRRTVAAVNPEEIELAENSMLDEEKEESEEEQQEEGEGRRRKTKEPDVELEQMKVPKEVFERNIAGEANEKSKQSIGALERLKRKRNQ